METRDKDRWKAHFLIVHAIDAYRKNTEEMFKILVKTHIKIIKYIRML
jgi:hypothetical protein